MLLYVLWLLTIIKKNSTITKGEHTNEKTNCFRPNSM